MTSADEYFRQRAGKSAEEMIKDGELLTPVKAVLLMKDFVSHVESSEKVEPVKVTPEQVLEAILKDVSDIVGVSVEVLKSKKRGDIATFRMFYYKRAKLLTSHSLAKIGLIVGKDHATVLHGLGVVDNVVQIKSWYEKLFEAKKKEPVKEVAEVTTQTMDMLIGRSPKVVNMKSPFESIMSETIRPYSGHRVHSF